MWFLVTLPNSFDQKLKFHFGNPPIGKDFGKHTHTHMYTCVE